MSLFRLGIVVAAAIMLLPVEDKKQGETAASPARTAEHSATFCERNPNTCANARDAWALFLRKAEHAMELSARFLREQLARSLADEPQRAQPASHVPHVRSGQPHPSVFAEPAAHHRRPYPMDNPSRWR